MNTLADERRAVAGEKVKVTADTLLVELSDGRTITAPLAWFPRLLHGTVKERNHWRFIGRGEGIHWPDLDEDISVGGLVLGKPSGESQASAGKARPKKKALNRMVGANTCNKFDPTSPFGGYKESGVSREGGLQGLAAYCRPD